MRTHLTEWEVRFKNLGVQKDAEVAQLRVRVGELEPLPSQLADRDQRLAEWELRYKNLGSEKDGELAKLRARVGELQPLQAQLTDRDQRLAAWDVRFKSFGAERDTEAGKLQAQLADRDRKLAEWDARYQSLGADKDGELARLRARVAEIESSTSAQIADRDRKLADWDARYRATVGDRDAEIQRLIALLAEREAALEKAKARPASPPKANERDDLKKIWGIGPVLEKRLNGLGVYYFRQIAEWTRDEIAYFSDQLKEFPDRIERDNWADGAADEHFKKYHERLSLKAGGAGA